MKTTSRFVVLEEASVLATRSAGSDLRAILMDRLQHSAHVVLDFHDVPLTPSFADEFLGVTIETIGREQFKARVSMINLSEAAKSLVRHILNSRAKAISPLPLMRQHA